MLRTYTITVSKVIVSDICNVIQTADGSICCSCPNAISPTTDPEHYWGQKQKMGGGTMLLHRANIVDKITQNVFLKKWTSVKPCCVDFHDHNNS